MAVDLFAAGSAQTLVLLAARVGGLVMVAPVFSTKNVPVAVRACLIVLLTVLLQPVAFTQSTSVASITCQVRVVSPAFGLYVDTDGPVFMMSLLAKACL